VEQNSPPRNPNNESFSEDEHLPRQHSEPLLSLELEDVEENSPPWNANNYSFSEDENLNRQDSKPSSLELEEPERIGFAGQKYNIGRGSRR
jgi:hypothetical protein